MLENYFSFIDFINESVVIGEWGGKYLPGSLDHQFQNMFVDWLVKNDLRNAIYWALNPNSVDTGGVLQSDWLSLHPEKLALISRLQPNPSKIFYDKNSGKYFYSLNEDTYAPQRPKSAPRQPRPLNLEKEQSESPEDIKKSMQQTLDKLQLSHQNLTDNYRVLHQLVQSLVELESAKLQYEFNLRLHQLQTRKKPPVQKKKQKEPEIKPSEVEPKV